MWHMIDTKYHQILRQSLRVRGGGIIEENPEYTSDNGSSDDGEDEYDDETSLEEEEEDKSSSASSSTKRKKNVKLYNHSKQRRATSKNKQVKNVYERIRDGLFSLVGYNNHQRSDDEDEIVDGKTENVTEKGEEEEEQSSTSSSNPLSTFIKRIPIVPILYLAILLLIQFILPQRMTLLFVPLILRTFNNGDINPDSALGKLLYPILGGKEGYYGSGSSDLDVAIRMAYVPSLEQHYTFEQLNERYYRDWGAYKKALGVNSLVAMHAAGSGSGRSTFSSSVTGGSSNMGASLSSLLGSSSRGSDGNTNSSKLSSSSSISKGTSSTFNYPRGYSNNNNNGTVIILDMTKLDAQVSKMESIRDQISFVVRLVDSLKEEDEEEVQKEVRQMAGSIVNAMHKMKQVNNDDDVEEKKHSLDGDDDDVKNATGPTTVNATESEESHLTTGANETLLNVTLDNNEMKATATATQSTTTTTTTAQSESSPPIIVEVIVLLESAGGGVSQYGLAASHLQRLRSNPNIQLTICVDTIAASGGYMMACMSSPGQLYCAPFAMIGSIGVIGQSINVQKTLEKYGIKPYVFRGGKMKNPVGMVGDVTKDGVVAMQGMIDRVHDAFRDHVRDARGGVFSNLSLLDGIPKPAGNYFQLSSEQSTSSGSIEHVLDHVATGDVFLGTQALKMGLVDRLITSDEYINERIRQNARVLKLVNYHKVGLSGLFSPPSHRGGMMKSGSMVSLLKKVVYKITSALLVWADDGLSNSDSSIPTLSAGNIVDDLEIF